MAEQNVRKKVSEEHINILQYFCDFILIFINISGIATEKAAVPKPGSHGGLSCLHTDAQH
jgi:hypothetical protein